MLKSEIAELIADWRMVEAGDTSEAARVRNLRLINSYPKSHLVNWLNYITAPKAEKAEAKRIMDESRPRPGGRGRSAKIIGRTR